MQTSPITEQLRAIRDEVLALTTSPLYEDRIKSGAHPVIGEGHHGARAMFIGEAPGRNEAATGRPFVGAAGKILDQLFASIDIDRSSVYITNIVKDRPPSNRDPFPEEIASYGPFLDRQIQLIQPEVLIPLGRYAAAYIMEHFGCKDKLAPISALHGTVIPTEASYGPITIVPLYHPAVAVYNASTKETLIRDFAVLKTLNIQPKTLVSDGSISGE